MISSFNVEHKPGLYAGFWKRCIAHIIDNAIFFIYKFLIINYCITYVVAKIIMPLLFNDINSPAHFRIAVYIATAAGFLGWILYYGFFESSSKQGTIGKQAMRIVVVDMNGKRVSLLRATSRAILISYPLILGLITNRWIFFIALGIWFFMMLTVTRTKKKQGIHDMLTGCLVINKDYKI